MNVAEAGPLRIGAGCARIEAIGHGDRNLSVATGSFFQVGQRFFLVSNWHVFAGVNHRTREVLDERGAVPEQFVVKFSTLPDGATLNNVERILELNNDDGDRVWFDHPVAGRNLDIAAMEVTDRLPGPLFPVNADIIRPIPGDDHIRLPIIQEGAECFVLGYPRALSANFGMPIWKRASVATSLRGGIDNQPKFWIDTASTKGMSGAPVVFRSETYLVEGDDGPQADLGVSVGRTAQILLGIYSGRNQMLSDDPVGAQLGLVWRVDAIHDMLRRQIDDTNSS